ncbi:hypothetical protein HA402_000373 [Bradysia odoriphaga]|nr:hypothetical protein HA402_000373 [Bradysia odoriphaga]
MTPLSTRNIGLVLMILCIVCAMETLARITTNKRREKSNINLCSKDIDMKLACHCSHEDNRRTVMEVDCLVLHEEFPQSDPAWQSFRQHPNLKHFILTVHRNGYMSYLPSDILKYQKELRTITITYADIREIPTYAFGNLTKLENITLIKSQIEVLDIHSFANHESLRGLNLEENQIVDIDRYAFTNLPELQELLLTKNNLTTLHDEMFADLGNLAKLKLNENLISILTKEMFKGLGNLRHLDLSINNVKYIGDAVFAELWSLQELDLESNSIERLSERAFDGLNNLRTLNLKNNKLETLESGVFTGAPAVTSLYLNNNLLDTLTYSNVLPLMDNLVNNTSILSLSGNPFVCDCRLNWMYDLRNRTKNINLRRSLDKMVCSLDKSQYDPSKHTRSNNKFNFNHRNYNDDSDNYENELGPYDDLQKSIDGNAMIELRNINVEHLPCTEELSDPTELPLSRESIGMDLSWLSGAGTCDFGLWH